jgi:hypothetical protein
MKHVIVRYLHNTSATQGSSSESINGLKNEIIQGTN